MKQCYDLATPRIRQYLQSEINFTLNHIQPGDKILELGCGYGRILHQLTHNTKQLFGIDTSFQSMLLAREIVSNDCQLAAMNAIHLGFRDNVFDVVCCLQNGISAFHIDPLSLIRESIRVTKPGGIILFSTYSEKFWEHRLEWFRMQSEAGVLGQIDEEKTTDGNIVCKDGFTATTFTGKQFASLCSKIHVASEIIEVDESSLFCIIHKSL